MNLVHSCVILLLVIVEIVVDPCMFLGESQVGGEVVDTVTHSLFLLMQSTLCTKEVALGDVGVHVFVLPDEEWVGISTLPIHHCEQICEWEKEKNLYQMTWTVVEDGSMITQMWNKEIAQLVPILVGFSHLHKQNLIVELGKDGGTKFDAIVSEPQ